MIPLNLLFQTSIRRTLQSSLCIATFLILWTGFAGAEVLSRDKRFIDSGNDTITDTETGLMWQKMDSYLHTGHWMSWDDAPDYIKQLNESGFGGYIDWRMPTVQELRTLYEEDKENGKQTGRGMVIHMDPVFAPNGGGSHWSSEANGRFNGLGVIFNDGQRFSSNKSSKSRKSIRAVRKVNP